MQQLFVYGTLLFPEIVKKLTGKQFKTSPAVIRKFARKRIIDRDYPAIIEDLFSEVKGILIRDVDDQSLHVLTFYEGTEYEKRETEVWAGNEKTMAVVFVWKGDLDDLETRDWDENKFRDRFLQVYLDKVIPETLNEIKQFDLDF